MARTVIVTGGGTGIGRAITAAFARSGDSVIITGRRRGPIEAAAKEEGGSVSAAVCDGTDPEQVGAFADDLPGRVDVLVNCAGGNTDFDREPARDLATLAGNWRANMDANLLTAVLMTEAVRDRLADGGSVISIGSIAADKGSGPYGVAKAALASWNVYESGRLGPRGVTANVVAPGLIDDTEFFRGSLSEERRKQLIAMTRTGRVGTPDEVAETVHFLASGSARQITAQVLAVNGGAHPTR
ncbi:SDR family NAD(P)-dependent oxidoreductase [Nocardiopsis sediminis]|uniref:SDR family NAD(P)-dependent oxidoreductase n=1 Tax=Nocardiopsis sediminis TaxID=1778267 RepID=A0ABV8FHA6_9ACTN